MKSNDWTIILAVTFLAIAIVLNVLNIVCNCLVPKIATPVCVLGLSFWYFFRGYKTHRSQNTKLDTILDILTGSSVKLNGKVTMTRSMSEVYVSIVFYAMSKSKDRGAFDYKVIDKKNPEVIRFIIQTMLASFNSNYLNGYIGDDDCLVINTFDRNMLNNPITDGRKLVKEYEHFNTNSLVRGAVARINTACSINENYSGR